MQNLSIYYRQIKIACIYGLPGPFQTSPANDRQIKIACIYGLPDPFQASPANDRQIKCSCRFCDIVKVSES